MKPFAAACALALLALAAGGARADLLDPIKAGDEYSIESYCGPVMGNARVIGLAGAYSAIAEEAVGIPWNPASAANRTRYSDSLFDYDVAFDFILANAFRADHFDFDNNDRSLESNLWVIHLGGYLQLGFFGAGVYLRSQNLTLHDNSGREYEGGLLQGQFCIGAGFFDHQFVAGLGVRTGSFDMSEKADPNNKYATSASGLELGLLFSAQFRLFDISFLGDYSIAVSFAIDLTHRYNNMSFGIGFWH